MLCVVPGLQRTQEALEVAPVAAVVKPRLQKESQLLTAPDLGEKLPVAQGRHAREVTGRTFEKVPAGHVDAVKSHDAAPEGEKVGLMQGVQLVATGVTLRLPNFPAAQGMHDVLPRWP